MKTVVNKTLSVLISIVLVIGALSISPIASSAATNNQNNIVGWADYLYGITWTAKQNVTGWKYTFSKGETAHIPYSQPVNTNGYIGYGISVDNFLTATNDIGSKFYTDHSYYNRTSTYYGMDCSSFVSLCWGVGRQTTASIPKIASGKGTLSNSIDSLQLGDALNYNGSNEQHVILVTDISYSNGQVSSVEITEETPPQLKRTTYSRSGLINRYGYYSIYRYEGSVPVPPNNEPEISYSVNLNEGEYIKGANFPITGKVSYGGRYPWLHLYVDYGWVADTANNSEGNYAFYLDTTKYSDGEHLIGIKITNEDGLDFTTWRKVYIDNSKPNISNIYLSQVSDSSFRVCVVVSDNIAIDHVRVATWTKSDQSDLIWHDCYFNGSETYFIDLRRSDYSQGATQYYNHAYVYDYAGNNDVKVVTMTFEDSYSLVSAIYYSQIGRDSFRICCQVRDNDDISNVRVATWATGNMSDIKWQDCYYNGYGTYFMDLQRSDYLNGAKRYISHLYVYDKNGGCESFEKSIFYDDNPPIISDITISEKTSKGFRISCCIEDESSIKSVQFPTWRSDNNQNDLIWYNAEIVDNVATCYIPISNHNNAYGTYFIHIYAYDYFDNLGTGRAAVTINPPLIGDTNLDGTVDVNDATLIQRYSAKIITFTDAQLALADLDGNGTVDINDATKIQRIAARIE